MVEETRCGYVAIIGRPNVGKSTLLNHLLGRKISITSKKAQTTRHRILGVKTVGNEQIVYVDTPGIHQHERNALNQYMNRVAHTTLHDVDILVFLIDYRRWTEEDSLVLKKLTHVKSPVILAINKIDMCKDRQRLLPLIEEYSTLHKFQAIIPLSAKNGTGLSLLEEEIRKLLPESVHFFPEGQVTDRSERFFAAEIVREKLMRHLGEEIPYSLTLEVEQFENEENLLKISILILVERTSQKAIVIGKQGERLKEVGQYARLDMEKFFGKKVFLRLWVKVKEGWADNKRALKSLGYD